MIRSHFNAIMPSSSSHVHTTSWECLSLLESSKLLQCVQFDERYQHHLLLVIFVWGFTLGLMLRKNRFQDVKTWEKNLWIFYEHFWIIFEIKSFHCTRLHFANKIQFHFIPFTYLRFTSIHSVAYVSGGVKWNTSDFPLR